MKNECEYLGPRLSAYLDGELSEKERQDVKMHLETCKVCNKMISELEEVGAIIKTTVSPELEPKVDLTGVWEEIEARADFGPGVWQKIRNLFGKPAVFWPAAVASAAAVLFVFMLPILRAPAPIEASRVEAIYSRTGQVMMLKTAVSGRPLIWILPGAEKEVGS